MKYILDNLKNNIDFFLRKNIKISRKNYYEKPENKQNIFKTQEQIKIFEMLKNKYNLELFENLSNRNFLENLYFLNIFDKYFSKEIKNNSTICDIGSKNWYYAKSEYIFFEKKGLKTLDGVEIDGNRLNNKFYSREEIAKFHTKNLPNTKYFIKDFLLVQNYYDYIIWILPFVSEYPHIKWGLPKKYYCPEKMLFHAYNQLNKNGEMLIINQGKNEYNIQKELNKRLNLNAEYFGEIKDLFNLFSHKRYVSVIKK